MVAFPRDANGQIIPNSVPARQALAVTYDATVSASTEITLNAATEIIEVTALDKAILLNWGTTDASTTAFDEVIAPNTSKLFVVPTDVTAVNFIEQAATAILIVVEK